MSPLVQRRRRIPGRPANARTTIDWTAVLTGGAFRAFVYRLAYAVKILVTEAPLPRKFFGGIVVTAVKDLAKAEPLVILWSAAWVTAWITDNVPADTGWVPLVTGLITLAARRMVTSPATAENLRQIGHPHP